MSEIKLETKLVGEISGKFEVKSYQRGYRWGEKEVKTLLDDIYNNGTNNYCLQPIVVKNNGDVYELIDGQQRLTTLFLIYKYMHKESNGFLSDAKFSLKYETREKSETFLSNIDNALKDDNIDFYFIATAYETIKEWFNKKENKQSTLTNINKYFDENVRIIWYEIPETEDPIALFTRLNIGKIPLTSSELVKAMFLSKDNNSGMDERKQHEISLQWDNMERELHNDNFWGFLTNEEAHKYQTRIDFVLNLMANKTLDEKEVYFTFFYFDELRNTKSNDKIWEEIQLQFLTLKEWFENQELYHKIGYLVACKYKTLKNLADEYQGQSKSQFKTKLDTFIKESISLKNDKKYGELSYENDKDDIFKLLLLFNVETVRNSDDKAQRFPFYKFKFDKDENVSWSLEHIHAQQSKGLNTNEKRREWLKVHIPSVKAVLKCGDDNDLVIKMHNLINAIDTNPKNQNIGNEFEQIQGDVVEKLSENTNGEYIHQLANLALLNCADNSALNNSVFDVKRNQIIEMDKRGAYIPFCTKMVFLKYYSKSEETQLHFWGKSDRDRYIDAINETLKEYLQEQPIKMEEIENAD